MEQKWADPAARERVLQQIRSVLAQVAEAPWSGAEWAIALRFDRPRGTVLVLLLSDTPLGVLGFRAP